MDQVRVFQAALLERSRRPLCQRAETGTCLPSPSGCRTTRPRRCAALVHYRTYFIVGGAAAKGRHGATGRTRVALCQGVRGTVDAGCARRCGVARKWVRKAWSARWRDKPARGSHGTSCRCTRHPTRPSARRKETARSRWRDGRAHVEDGGDVMSRPWRCRGAHEAAPERPPRAGGKVGVR